MQPTLLTYAKWLLLLCAILYMAPVFSQESGLLHRKSSNLYETTLIHKFNGDKAAVAPADITSGTDPREEKCLTMESDAALRKRIPNIGSLNDFEQDLQKNIGAYKERMRRSRTQATIYTIPVIVHVIHNGEPVGTGANISAAQVQSQIEVLNEDFRRKTGTPGFNNNPIGADVEIEFALALRDAQGNTLPEPGIHRVNGKKVSWNTRHDVETNLKPSTFWDPEKYLNLWTVNFGGDMKNLLGYAQFPIKSGLKGLDLPDYPTGANTDGVVIRYAAFGRGGNVPADFTGRTATHEIGHWLGLRHIWADDNGGCEEDDFCNDTPQTADKHYGCSKGENTCTAPGMDMVENYMDYSDDACVNIFTQDQKTRMRTVIESCPRRKELLSSTVHLPVGDNNKPIADFTTDRTIACDGATIQFNDKSSANTTAWNWTFFDGSGNKLSSFNNKNQKVTFTGAGTYGVQLVASNAAGTDTLFFSNYITILANTNLAAPFIENSEGTTTYPGWVSYNPDGDRIWMITDTVSANGDGTHSTFFDNYSGDEKDNPYGTVDGLISNRINLATNQNAELTFDVAYARYDDKLIDSLVIFYSTDCGQNFKPFWVKGGKDLATAPDTEENFIPTNTQWRKETVSLSFLNGNASVYLAIVNKSGWGNTLYLDNVKISVPVVTQKPVAAFNTTQQAICVGSSIMFSDVSQHSPKSWSWTFPGGTPSSSTQQHPSVTYNTPGTYPVTLTATNALGSGTITKQAYITVSANPVLQVTASKTSICLGDSVELTVSGAAEYSWFQGTDLLEKGAKVIVKPAKDATYIVRGANSSGCESESSIQITVNTSVEKPTVSISAPADSATVTLTCQSTADAYQWFRNGTAIANATSKDYNVTQAGTYTVTITAGECSSTSDAVVLTANPEEELASKSYKAYPNPTSDQLMVELPTGAKTVKVSIYNSLGLLVTEQQVSASGSNNPLKLSVGQYPNGHYLLRVVGEGTQYTQSFIKQ